MKIINVKQGSEEWLKWRRSVIGASDIPVIMGTNPYGNLYKLWEDKCGYDKPKEMTEAMKHGQANEDKARKWLNFNLNLELEPLCVQSKDNAFMAASLDGWDASKKELVEIKCPFSYTNIEKAKKDREIPDYYRDQVQWQMILTNAKKATVAIWDWKEEYAILFLIKEDKERQKLMIKEAKNFWNNHVKTGIAPENPDEYIEIENPELEVLIQEYIELDKKEKHIQLLKKGTKDRIIEFGDDGNFKCYGVKVKRMQPKKCYDISKMKADGIDVSKYVKVKTSIGYYQIFLPK
jgi:putative phage-type endonuclease